MSYYSEPDGQLTFLNPESPQNTLGHLKQRAKPKSMDDLIAIPFLYLDLSLDHVNLFGKPYWELHSPIGRENRPSTPGLRPGSRSGDYSLKFLRNIQTRSIIFPR